MRAAIPWKRASLRQSPEDRQAMARVLGTAHPYALAPFVMMQTRRGLRLVAAVTPPPVLDADELMRWDDEPDTDVVEIDLMTGAAALVGEPGAWLVGDLPIRNHVHLFTDGRTWARAWAANRLAHLSRYQAAALQPVDAPDHCLPGLLLTGPVSRVTIWAALLTADRVTIDDPAHVRAVRAALMGAAGVPNVEASAPSLRKAA